MAIVKTLGTSGADILTDNGNEDQSYLRGGAGNDTYLLTQVGGPWGTDIEDLDVVVESAGGGTDTVVLNYYYGGGGGGPFPFGGYTAELDYSLADNVENFTANFYGGNYFASFIGPYGGPVQFAGGAEIEVYGNALNNVITTGNGDDFLQGGAYGGAAGGKDTLVGGDGNDTYFVDSSDDVIIEHANPTQFPIGLVVPYGGPFGVIVAGPIITFDMGGEHDQVYSSATYTLSDNVEDLELIGDANINGTGNAQDNDIDGNDGNNTLSGLGGDDNLDGEDGNDKLLGGEGNDDLEGENGNDTLDGGNGNDDLDGSDGRDSLIGGAGDDELDGGWHDSDIDTLVGGAGNDVYYVYGTGVIGVDVIKEDANGGTDTVYVNGYGGPYTLANNVENGVLAAYGDISELIGNTSDNSLIGNQYNNVLRGLGGADALDGGEGADVMYGGDGNDSYLVENPGDRVIESNSAAAGGIDTVYSSINYYMLGDNVENLVLDGNAMVGIGNTRDNTITGNNQINILSGGAGNDTYVINSSLDRVIEIAESGTGGLKDKIILTADFNGYSGGNYIIQPNVEQLDASATHNGVSITGNNSDNTIIGGAGDDTLDGRAGDDSMAGGAGDDTYFVFSTGDVVTEATNAGIDTVFSNVFSYTLANNVENGIMLGGSSLTGNTSNNFLLGNSGANSLSGGDGNDTLDGGAGLDVLNGGKGNDLYIVRAGDTITGETSGVDTVQTARNTYSLADTVVGGAGVTAIDYLVFTGSGSFTGTGNGLANSIVGGSSNDILNGGTGNAADTLDGGAGVDVMAGGGGNDTYFVDDSGDVVTEIPGGGTDSVFSTALTYTLSAEVEKLTLVAGAGNINATGNTLANTITGNEGDNSIDGGGGNDTMAGGKGNDTYVVDATGDKVTETDTLANGGGNDTVKSTANYTLGANLENLILLGTAANGTGNGLDNHIDGNASANTLKGLDGNDSIVGGNGNDSLDGGNGNDSLFGENDNDTLNGGAGNDYLDGGSGTDSMTGGTGDDFYVVDSALDKVVEAADSGNDTVRYESAGTYTLVANVETAIFYGGAGSNVSATAGDNTNNTIIAGFNGNDISTGGGNDTISLRLEGGFVDTIDGGDGIDTLNVTLGDFEEEGPYGGLIFNNESVTSSLSNLENIVITSNGAAYGSGGVGTYGGPTYYGGVSGYHSWNMGGFDGTTSAHNHIAIKGGEYGGGALALSGFGKHVDFTLYDYDRDSDYSGIDLTGVSGGWSASDTLQVTLDDFSGRLIANGGLGDLDLTSSGGINAENGVDLGDFDTTITVVNVTGDTALSIFGADDGSDITVKDFNGTYLQIGLQSNSGSDDLTLGLSNVNTSFYGGDFETININSSGNNFLGLSSLDPGNTDVLVTGADGLLFIQSNGGDLDASGFNGELVVNASNGIAALNVIGGTGDDIIIGSNNGDTIDGGTGLDVLIGGDGADLFLFTDGTAGAPEAGPDLVADFITGIDSIHLNSSIFTNVGAGGALDPGFFVAEANVVDHDDGFDSHAYVLYDTNTGSLYYDSDGGATDNAVQFAQLGLGSAPSLAASDIIMT